MSPFHGLPSDTLEFRRRLTASPTLRMLVAKIGDPNAKPPRPPASPRTLAQRLNNPKGAKRDGKLVPLGASQLFED
jgi:hypothetical protein